MAEGNGVINPKRKGERRRKIKGALNKSKIPKSKVKQ
jgi:hypothetical protein